MVARDVFVHLTTLQFDYVVERIRDQVIKDGAVALNRVFVPLDEEGVMFLSAESLDAAEFRSFVQVAQRAAARAREEPFYASGQETWRRVMAALVADERSGCSR